LSHALLVLRVLVGLIMAAHGVARLYATSQGTGVPAFGAFLADKGFPAPLAQAWIITVVECAGGLALALGFAVPVLCLWFAAELAVGIVLVHARFGWFVVGPHLAGMEYSVLLITSMLVVASDALEKARRPT
jgi:putative oxidoreductase